MVCSFFIYEIYHVSKKIETSITSPKLKKENVTNTNGIYSAFFLDHVPLPSSSGWPQTWFGCRPLTCLNNMFLTHTYTSTNTYVILPVFKILYKWYHPICTLLQHFIFFSFVQSAFEVYPDCLWYMINDN